MSNIMIVEDEALIALSLQTKLEKFGYTVLAVVHTGEDAVVQAAACNPDLILMDINLAGAITGITAAERIHEHQPIPVIFLTAYSDEATLQKAKSAEPLAYLIKPFKDRELRATIEVALFKHAKEMEERNIAQAKAAESDRLKSVFLKNISHELRTPMNGILGFTELLKRPGFSSESQQKFLQNIEISGDRLISIVNDILNISQIESNSVTVSMAETDINEQVQNVFDTLQSEAEKKGLRLLTQTTLPPHQAKIKTDGEMVSAILNHLVKNAIKFTHAGSVEFGYRLMPDNQHPLELDFFVKDTGIGIPEDKQKIIFEKFRQVDESQSRGYEGAGLGLSIAKAFVELLGGKIRVESELNNGSVFYFTIPFSGVDTILPTA